MSRVRRVAAVAASVALLFVARASAQGAAWPSESPPRPLSAHDVKFPPYELRTLQNGMQVVVVMHHEQPAVSARLIVRAGSAQDPVGKVGVASLAAALLDQGTTTRTAGQIADTVDSVGGDSETGAGRDLSYARILVMKDSFDLGMSLLADEVRNPAFAETEIERQRQQMLSALKVSYDDPEYMANIVFDRLVYGFNPYGAPTSGTPDSLPRITRADLQAFHRRWYAPNNCLLAVVGDVTIDEAFAAVTRAFGDWANREVLPEAAADPPQPTRRVIVVDKPDAVQTEVRVGHLGIPRKQTDYMAMDLAIKILGGEGANRLHRVLRMERGLTYGASAEMETLKRAGEFVAITNTRSEATGEVLRLIVEQFNRLRLQRVNEQELADAKAYLTGNFPLRIETPDDIAMQVLNVLFYDLPVEELQTYRQRVNAVSADDITRVANAHLWPDRLSVVLVGNAKAFTSQLKAVGFDKYEVIPAGDIDLTTVDLRRRGTTTGTPGEAGRGGRQAGAHVVPAAHGSARPSFGSVIAPMLCSAIVRDGAAMDRRVRLTANRQLPGAGDAKAQAVLQRAIQAKGGADRLRAVRTVVMTGVMTVQSRPPVEARMTNYIQFPDKFRADAKLPNGDLTQVFADGDAWMQAANGVHDVQGQTKDALRATIQRDLVSLLLSAADGKLQVRLVAPQAGEAGKVDTLELSGAGLTPVWLLVDRRSGLVTGERYVVAQPGAIGKVPTEESYSDYRAVNGIQVAFRTVVRRGEAVILERRLTALRINVPLDEGLFKRPAGGAQSSPTHD
jgi:zinc protease